MAGMRDLQRGAQPCSPLTVQSGQHRLEVRLVALSRSLRLEQQGDLGRDGRDPQRGVEPEQAPGEGDARVSAIDPSIRPALQQEELEVVSRWRVDVDLVDRQFQPLVFGQASRTSPVPLGTTFSYRQPGRRRRTAVWSVRSSPMSTSRCSRVRRPTKRSIAQPPTTNHSAGSGDTSRVTSRSDSKSFTRHRRLAYPGPTSRPSGGQRPGESQSSRQMAHSRPEVVHSAKRARPWGALGLERSCAIPRRAPRIAVRRSSPLRWRPSS